MKKSFLSFFFLIIPFLFRAQVVVTEPPLPIDTQPVTVIFDAIQGSGGLAGYTGDVYAHTGVITNLSTSGSDWKYVKTNWGENTPETKLTRIGQDLYSLQVNPSIRSYYGVPVSEQILKMAFVFRSSEQVGEYGWKVKPKLAAISSWMFLNPAYPSRSASPLSSHLSCN